MVKLFVLILLLGLSTIPISNAEYLDTEISTGNTFSAGCWSPPSVPEPVGPADSSYTNAADITLEWNEPDFACPGQTIEYLYELNGEESAWLTETAANLALEEGVYGWRVKAKTDNHESAYSDLWTVTVDRTAPVTLMTFDGYAINESIVNGDFETNLSGWQTQGRVVRTAADAYTAPFSGSRMVRIGHKTGDSGNEIWENRLRQRLEPGAKNLSFYYNFFSFDAGLDDPGMVVRLNDHNVFYLSASDIDSGASPNRSGWTQLSFDISQISDPVLEIIFYSGNTGDSGQQSWVYLDKISTAEAVAEDMTNFILTADEPAETYYSLDGSFPAIAGTSFNLSTLIGDQVNFYSVDLAGNAESLNNRRIVKDIQSPTVIDDLEALAVSKQSVNLTWTVPEESTVYDWRSSLSPITEVNFALAAPVPNPPAPRISGGSQDFEVTGLDSATTYYFAVKSGDAALNWSAISNVVSVATMNEISEDTDLNPGDVVINELMWMGSSLRAADEYVELRNMTDRIIDLSGWQLTKNISGVETLMFTIPGGTIAAHGYFLISEYNQVNSAINVAPDTVVGAGNTNDANFVLADTNLQIKLYTAASLEMDTADNGSNSPAAGAHSDSLDRHWSMERDASPGNGREANVWHTCLDDSALMHSYWDSGRNDCGTPGRENLSQSPAAAESKLELISADHKLSFALTNISQFNLLNYEVTYGSDSGNQAIVGLVELDGGNQIEIKDLLLGTCSDGGACLYHEGIDKINLEVVLTGAIIRTLTGSLNL